ncbi:peptidoglycan-binding domain-containing protein [Hyphobacterium sp.]|uniref:peptidoglycan-binding domain-containing protein n=1 Tax=Hyphobacterium sp. TaxID=2004662 RepID=UPI003B51F1D9
MNIRKNLAAGAAIGAIAILAPGVANAQSDSELRQELQRAQQRIQQLESRLSADLPPATTDGQCFSRVLVPPSPRTITDTIIVAEARTETIVIPPQYQTVTEQVLIEEERTVRRVIPAQYETRTEQVLIRPERVERRIIPAVYETRTEQVLVEPERTVRRVVPAETRTVTETVTIQESRIEPVVIPAQYEEYTEQVLVREAYYTWQPSEPLYLASNSNASSAAEFARSNFSSSDLRELPTGEILCRVEVPAEYETVTRTRLVSPERIVYRTADGGTSPSPVELPPVTTSATRTEIITPERVVEEVIPSRYETLTTTVEVEPERVVEEIIPAEYETVQTTVVVEPERVVEEVIPARYETTTVERLVTPGREETRTIPPVTREVTRVSYDGAGNLAWREVLCEINTTPQAIEQIQIGLRDAGYYNGPVDGLFREQTYQAMVRYQEANGLVRGQLTRQFVEHLGVPWAPLTVNFYPSN